MNKPIYATSLIMFTLPISMPRFKSIIFYQNSPKIVIFAKKCKIFERWGLRPRTPQTAPPLLATPLTAYNQI